MSKRRKRRSSTEILAKRTLIDIKAKKLQFLRDVSKILSDALGFNVKVSLGKVSTVVGYTPEMRKAQRMTKKEARAQMREAFAPLTGHGIKLDDEVPF